MDMVELEETESLYQEPNAKAKETVRSVDQQMLVETLLPWWSKLVHRMIVAEEVAENPRREGEIDHVQDQRVSL